MKQRQDFRFLERLRVRWAEVDMQKIVFNGHYLMYADTAVAGYWRALALPYHDTMEAVQGDLYVRKATLEYLGSARYDEMLDVGVRTARIGNSSMLLETAVFRGPTVLVHGELVYVFADPRTQTSKPVPEALRQCLNAYESGAAPVRLETGPWSTLGPQTKALREAVLVREQGLPQSLVHDQTDFDALHAVARNGMGRVVACARVVRGGAPGLASLERVAVDGNLRRAGLGRWFTQALLAELAGSSEVRTVQLQAHAGATAFWAAMGFAPVGESTLEQGVPHQGMRRSIQ